MAAPQLRDSGAQTRPTPLHSYSFSVQHVRHRPELHARSKSQPYPHPATFVLVRPPAHAEDDDDNNEAGGMLSIVDSMDGLLRRQRQLNPKWSCPALFGTASGRFERGPRFEGGFDPLDDSFGAGIDADAIEIQSDHDYDDLELSGSTCIAPYSLSHSQTLNVASPSRRVYDHENQLPGSLLSSSLAALPPAYSSTPRSQAFSRSPQQQQQHQQHVVLAGRARVVKQRSFLLDDILDNIERRDVGLAEGDHHMDMAAPWADDEATCPIREVTTMANNMSIKSPPRRLREHVDPKARPASYRPDMSFDENRAVAWRLQDENIPKLFAPTGVRKSLGPRDRERSRRKKTGLSVLSDGQPRGRSRITSSNQVIVSHEMPPDVPAPKRQLRERPSMLSLCVERSRSRSPQKRDIRPSSSSSTATGAGTEARNGRGRSQLRGRGIDGIDTAAITSFDAVLRHDAEFRARPLSPQVVRANATSLQLVPSGSPTADTPATAEDRAIEALPVAAAAELVTPAQSPHATRGRAHEIMVAADVGELAGTGEIIEVVEVTAEQKPARQLRQAKSAVDLLRKYASASSSEGGRRGARTPGVPSLPTRFRLRAKRLGVAGIIHSGGPAPSTSEENTTSGKSIRTDENEGRSLDMPPDMPCFTVRRRHGRSRSIDLDLDLDLDLDPADGTACRAAHNVEEGTPTKRQRRSTDQVRRGVIGHDAASAAGTWHDAIGLRKSLRSFLKLDRLRA